MGGSPAAIAAARTGAKTVLVEKCGFLGGLLTAGMGEMSLWENDENGRQIMAGVWQETKERLVAMGASPGTLAWDGPIYGPAIKTPKAATETPFDVEAFKYVAAGLEEEAGVRMLLHAFIGGAGVDGNR